MSLFSFENLQLDYLKPYSKQLTVAVCLADGKTVGTAITPRHKDIHQ